MKTTGPLDDDDGTRAACRERLSALMDGELSGPALDQACGHWREAAGSRATWHAYHLIGDVLRSDDLAAGGERSAVFLQSLRVRIATEPTVLAPTPAVAPAVAVDRFAVSAAGNGWVSPDVSDAPGRSRVRFGWRGSTTFAAGVLAAAGVMMVVGLPNRPGIGSATTGSTLASGSGAMPQAVFGPVPTAAWTSPAPVAQSPSPVDGPRQLPPGDPLIRDARIDRYLEAHKQFAGTSALGVPSGFLRAATERVERR